MNTNILMDKEIWKPVAGYEGYYEVSNYGQVRSLDRLIYASNGKVYHKKGKILKQATTKHETLPAVSLAKDGEITVKDVRYIVYMNFFENAEEDDVVKHKDGDSTNNRVDNLYVEEIENLPGEEWRPVVGYESYYEVSNKGRLKSCKRVETYIRPDSGETCLRTRKARIVKLGTTQDGYQSNGLLKDGKSKDMFIHRLVATAFIPNPENKPQINHTDGDPSNNCVENLEWCTAQENIQDQITKRGRKNLIQSIVQSWGRDVVCLDTMEEFPSVVEAAQDLSNKTSGHLGNIAESIERRTCCFGYTYVFKLQLQNEDFDIYEYIIETKNRYSKWTRSGPYLEAVELSTHSLSRALENNRNNNRSKVH